MLSLRKTSVRCRVHTMQEGKTKDLLTAQAALFNCHDWHENGNGGNAHPRGTCVYCTVVREAKSKISRRVVMA